jgi:hypothetical protein
LDQYETGLAYGAGLSEKLEAPIQGQSVVDGGSILRDADQKAQTATGAETRLICKSFD